MPKNPNNQSRKDVAQIQKSTYCEEHDAVRIIQAADVETEISVSHKDNDSVAAMSACRVIPADEETDCSDLQKVQAYGNGFITLVAEAGSDYTITVVIGQIIEICAMSLKSTVILVGR